MNTKTDAPSTSTDFDKVYKSTFAHWMWSDIRIPKELKELIASNRPQTTLELGCGLARFSTFIAEQGIKATGVDFSPIAIGKAEKANSGKTQKPTLHVGDVTNLTMLNEQFDHAFDVGCFHCLYEEQQERYASEMYRLLNPQSTLLIWALDNSPSGASTNATYMEKIFKDKFQLSKSTFSRRRVVASHWYWLVRIK
jgi:ubiquinone/menaquinone biosynthesis C-methylase UbiE